MFLVILSCPGGLSFQTRLTFCFHDLVLAWAASGCSRPPAPPQLLRGLEEAHKRAGFDVKTLLQGLGGTSLLLLTVFYLTLLASLASSDSGSTPAPADEGKLERVGWWLMETGPVAVAEVSHV